MPVDRPVRSHLSGADVVAHVLGEAGVRQAFAYPGTSELALCDALDRSESISLVNARGDKEAAFMAAGASLLKPSSAIAVLHGARGLTNAAGALADVRRNEIGTLFLVGLPSTASARFLPPHGEEGLINAMAHFAGWTWEAPPVPNEVADRATAAHNFINALREGLVASAEPPRSPSLFAVPQDVAEQQWISPAYLAEDARVPDSRPTPDLASTLEALSGATRPVFLIDDYALASEGIPAALNDLSQRVGAPVLQVQYRRGPMLFERLSVESVRNFIGWFNPWNNAHRQLLHECDLLVTVEDRNMYPRVVGLLPPCRKLAITSDPNQTLKNGYLCSSDTLAVGDPAAVMRAIASTLDRAPAVLRWFEAALSAPTAVVAEAPVDLLERRAALCSAIGEVLAGWEGGALLDDSQMFGGLLSEHYDALPTGLRIFGDHGGFVGAGIPLATGLAISERRLRVMCTLGDEGFANGLQGLQAAVEEAARVLFIVCSNGGSVSLNKQASADLGPSERSYLASSGRGRAAKVARAMGVQSQAVVVPLLSSEPEFEAAMSELIGALAAADGVDSGPSMVELQMPSDLKAWAGIWQLRSVNQLDWRIF